MNLKNTFCTLCLWGWGFYVEPVFFNIFSCELYFDGCIDSRALLDFSIYGSGSWRGCTLKIVSWSVEGKVRIYFTLWSK